MIQILLSGEGQAMDPLVSLYYYAPVCTVMNFLVAGASELSSFQKEKVWQIGPLVLILNAAVAFLLNVASVFLIGKTSGLVMTLTGVLKNIIIVATSVLIWGTAIGGVQISGYAVALAGLVYYGVGFDGIMTYLNVSRAYASKLWSGSVESTISSWTFLTRKILLITLYATIVLLLLTGLAVKTGKAPEFVQDLIAKTAF